MSAPLWLMDVDGVLNAVTGADPPTWPNWRVARARGFSIRFSPDLVERVTRLVEDRAVEVRWLTTWSDTVADLPFTAWHGYPVAGREAEATVPAEQSWWKLGVARRLHEPGRPMVWTDDDIALDPEARGWLDARPEVLAISPDTAVGLTPQHLDRIEAFLRSAR